jgi:hypothetical protein
MRTTNVIFIAPAAGRRVNSKHFLGFTPGGEGGGVNYDAFPDFGRLSLSPSPECIPLAPGDSGWNTGWKLLTNFELEVRAQAHRLVRTLEKHPLTWEEHERLIDLGASGPLIENHLDERLEKLGLVEEYDGIAVQCSTLFFTQAYGQYFNLPYDGEIKLPRFDIHGNLHHY